MLRRAGRPLVKTLVAAFVLWGCQRPAPPAADLPRPAADGGPLSWDRGLPMTALGADTFEYRAVGLGAPLHFKPLLDDQVWSRGTNYQVAPGATAEVYPHFLSAQGTWSRYWPVFPQGGPSKFLGNQRGVWIYLPPSFHENPLATYPVLYMHDGQNLF